MPPRARDLLSSDNNVTTNSMSFALTQGMKYLEQWNPISAILRYEYNIYIYLCLVFVEIM